AGHAVARRWRAAGAHGPAHRRGATPGARSYVGAPLQRCARLLAVARGGQALLSGVTADLLRDQLPAEVGLRDLATHRLPCLSPPAHIFPLAIPGLVSDCPALRTLESLVPTLPIQHTSLLGREQGAGAGARRGAAGGGTSGGLPAPLRAGDEPGSATPLRRAG